MLSRVKGLFSSIWHWFRGLPLAGSIAIGVLVFAASAWGQAPAQSEQA